VKLQRHEGQYRVTIPRELILKADFEGVEFVRLGTGFHTGITIKEYHGKRKEKGDLPEGQA